MTIRMRQALGLAVLLGLAGCARRAPTAVPPVGFPEQGVATYAGTIPCADCEGQRVALTLWPDLTFRMRTTYLGRSGGQGADVYDLGRWSRTGGNGLSLDRGRQPPTQFRFLADGSLRRLDIAGEPIASTLNYDLGRQPAIDRVEGPMRVRGLYVFLADAAALTECRTAKSIPVLIDGDHLSLERAYLAARRQPGEAVFVTFTGRFVERAPEPGAAVREHLTVDTFEGASPGETCASPRSFIPFEVLQHEAQLQ